MSQIPLPIVALLLVMTFAAGMLTTEIIRFRRVAKRNAQREPNHVGIAVNVVMASKRASELARRHGGTHNGIEYSRGYPHPTRR